MSAARRLQRALLASARASGCPVAISATSEQPWASATFVGARHVLALDAPPSPALAAWLATLATTEIGLPGHVVADITARATAAGATIAALTLEI